MTNEEQRIAIAEHLGFTNAIVGKVGIVGKSLTSLDWVTIPDYPNDLNAMAQAEKVGILHSNELTLEYFNQLSKFAGPNARSIQDSVKIFCATAGQRAEAFLRTVGQWKESHENPNRTTVVVITG